MKSILLAVTLVLASAFPALAQRTYVPGPITYIVNQNKAASGTPCTDGRSTVYLQDALTEMANECDFGKAMPTIDVVSTQLQASFLPPLVGSWQPDNNLPTITGEPGAQLWCPFAMMSHTPWKITNIVINCAKGNGVYAHYGSQLFLQPPLVFSAALNAVATDWTGGTVEFLAGTGEVTFIGESYNAIFYAGWGAAILSQAVTFNLNGTTYTQFAEGVAGGAIYLTEATVTGAHQGAPYYTDGSAFLDPPANGWPQ